MAKKWIQSAIKKPGALRAAAKRMGAITKRGTINLTKMASKAKSTTMKRRINLARTLRKFHK